MRRCSLGVAPVRNGGPFGGLIQAEPEPPILLKSGIIPVSKVLSSQINYYHVNMFYLTEHVNTLYLYSRIIFTCDLTGLIEFNI